jgi:hypothetical protein
MEATRKPAARHRRILWSGAWLGTAVVFLFGLGWGYVPPGFILWTIVAAPLAVLTYRWLVRLGYEIPRLGWAALWILWAALCVLVYTTRPRSPDWVQNLLAGFAGLVTLLGVVAGALAETESAPDSHGA